MQPQRSGLVMTGRSTPLSLTAFPCIVGHGTLCAAENSYDHRVRVLGLPGGALDRALEQGTAACGEHTTTVLCCRAAPVLPLSLLSRSLCRCVLLRRAARAMCQSEQAASTTVPLSAPPAAGGSTECCRTHQMSDRGALRGCAGRCSNPVADVRAEEHSARAAVQSPTMAMAIVHSHSFNDWHTADSLSALAQTHANGLLLRRHGADRTAAATEHARLEHDHGHTRRMATRQLRCSSIHCSTRSSCTSASSSHVAISLRCAAFAALGLSVACSHSR